MNWFPYDRDLLHERVKFRNFSDMTKNEELEFGGFFRQYLYVKITLGRETVGQLNFKKR